jgi:ParB-like chromosome segregation protein Spo0J
MSQLQVAYVTSASLAENPRNARTHSKKQIRQIANSIREFGFINPILVDAQNVILAGHGRLAAAKHLCIEKVPCVRIEDLTPEQKRAYVLADNKLALNATMSSRILLFGPKITAAWEVSTVRGTN